MLNLHLSPSFVACPAAQIEVLQAALDKHNALPGLPGPDGARAAILSLTADAPTASVGNGRSSDLVLPAINDIRPGLDARLKDGSPDDRKPASRELQWDRPLPPGEGSVATEVPTEEPTESPADAEADGELPPLTGRINKAAAAAAAEASPPKLSSSTRSLSLDRTSPSQRISPGGNRARVSPSSASIRRPSPSGQTSVGLATPPRHNSGFRRIESLPQHSTQDLYESPNFAGTPTRVGSGRKPPRSNSHSGGGGGSGIATVPEGRTLPASGGDALPAIWGPAGQRKIPRSASHSGSTFPLHHDPASQGGPSDDLGSIAERAQALNLTADHHGSKGRANNRGPTQRSASARPSPASDPSRIHRWNTAGVNTDPVATRKPHRHSHESSSTPTKASSVASAPMQTSFSIADLLTKAQLQERLQKQQNSLEASSNLLTMFLNRCNSSWPNGFEWRGPSYKSAAEEHGWAKGDSAAAYKADFLRKLRNGKVSNGSVQFD